MWWEINVTLKVNCVVKKIKFKVFGVSVICGGCVGACDMWMGGSTISDKISVGK